jgi:drug/metabolite transporter (DMT)-like permease
MKPKNALQLFLAAFIWGIAFVAQSSASAYIRPFTFNGIRCLIGALTLLPLLLSMRRQEKKNNVRHSLYALTAAEKKTALLGGCACGLCLCLGSTIQQFGIAYTTVGKAGFITALYIVFVPVVSALLFHKKITLPIAGSVLLGLIGLFTLCIKDDLSINTGDFYILICSFAFTAHILVIDHFSARANGVLLSCLQFFVCGVISLPFILFVERPQLSAILAAGIPILYAGVLSCGVAYTLQIVGQKNMDPTISSLILCMESVVSVLAGWVLLGQALSLREILGCIILFAAILLATLTGQSDAGAAD